MNLQTLLSILLVYRSNFHLLHWNAKGCKFDKIHQIAADYYEKLLDDSDIIAEMAMRLGQNVVNYPEAFETLKNYKDLDFTILESNIRYNFEDFTKLTAKMFKDITTAIEQELETAEMKTASNVGIKATLEGLHDYYDLQLRYINARRMEE